MPLVRPRFLALAALLAFVSSCKCTDCDGREPAQAAAGSAAVRHDFEAATAGATPAGFTEEVGTWRVVDAEGGGKSLAQLAESDRPTFNVALATEPAPRDLALRVRFRSVSGEVDQGGGPVWRARDARNYYICRYNPLEENFRVYKVIDGERTQLAGAKVDELEGWHEIAVSCVGNEMRCSLDGAELLVATDDSLPDAGRVGLWTKADAVTWFDDLVVEAR